MALKKTHKTAMTGVITIIVIKFNNKKLSCNMGTMNNSCKLLLKCDREEKTCRKNLNVSRQG